MANSSATAGWTVAGVLLAVVGVLIAFLAWQYPRQPGGQSAPIQAVVTSYVEAPGSPFASADVTPEAVDQHISPPVEPAADPLPPNPLYLAYLDEDFFVKAPLRHTTGAASMAGVSYGSSYTVRFLNCSACVSVVEFNVPAGYLYLTGDLGLTDDSRHDDVIDGMLYFTIFGTSGQLLYGPQLVEFPDSVPLSLSIAGESRISIEISEGTNYETACLCNVALTT